MAYGTIMGQTSNPLLQSHINDKNNPHEVTASQAGAISTTEKGQPNGVASLDQTGKIPVNQLPTISGKKYACAVVGTSTAGWTAADCDFLCDGTDDQVEINAAANLTNSYNGGEILLLPGTYNLSDIINISATFNHPPIILRGLGPLYTGPVLKWTGTYTSSSTVPDGGSNSGAMVTMGNSVLSNIIIDMSDNTQAAGNVGVSMYTNCKIYNCLIRNCPTGVLLVGAGNTTLQDCYFANNGKYCVYARGQGKVINSEFLYNAGLATVYIDATTEPLIVSNNIFSGRNPNLICSGYAKLVLISNNVLYNSTIVNQAQSSSQPTIVNNIEQ